MKWVTESNRALAITSDRELLELLSVGRPHISIPSPKTVARDIKTSFSKCQDRIGKMLRDHPGRLHFATDAWTSPNHRAFVAWTVHLEFQGSPLSFLLDIIEVPESHTGATLANAFQDMLMRFGLTEKVLAVNADNASSNDTQTEALAEHDNSFEAVNRVRCFNHTGQLSAKAVLEPFNPALGKAKVPEDGDTECDAGVPGPMTAAESDEDIGDEEIEEREDTDDSDDGIEELQELDEADRDNIIKDTAIVRGAVTKLRNLSFAIIHSTTKALPAWRRYCEVAKLKPNLIPRDVVTRWNSTFDMMTFALDYRKPIDAITADKTLKLRKHELEEEDWTIVSELVALLGVSCQFQSDRTLAHVPF